MSETSTVAVIGRDGERHEYDADDWRKDDDGHLFVTKDGENVAIFAPGQGEVVPAAETGTIIVVIDPVGRHHNFEADDWNSSVDGYVEVLKSGGRVASFGPRCHGVYRRDASRGPLPAKD